jgi:hypothetical protein
MDVCFKFIIVHNYQNILAVLAPLRSSLIIVPVAVSNTLTKVPCKKLCIRIYSIVMLLYFIIYILKPAKTNH